MVMPYKLKHLTNFNVQNSKKRIEFIYKIKIKRATVLCKLNVVLLQVMFWGNGDAHLDSNNQRPQW